MQIKEYEDILAEALSYVPNYIDKTEGSIIYDAIAPCCAELAQMYSEIGVFYNEIFADTCSRDALFKRMNERGIDTSIYGATKADCLLVVTQKDTTEPLEIPKGTKFFINNIYYSVVEHYLGREFEYVVQCDIAGTVGNKNIGECTCEDFIENLDRSDITEILVAGADEVDTEIVRAAYFADIRRQTSFTGSVGSYMNTVKAISGGQVIGVRVVKHYLDDPDKIQLVCMSSTFDTPSSELIESLQHQIFDENNIDAFAPIGHIVTVSGVEHDMLTISFDVTTIKTDTDGNPLITIDEIKEQSEPIITDYLNALNKNWESYGYIIYSDIEDGTAKGIKVEKDQIFFSLMAKLSNYATFDADSIKINGVHSDYLVNPTKIPKLEDVVVNEV